MGLPTAAVLIFLTNVAAMTKNKKFAKAAYTKAPDFSPNALGLISGMFLQPAFDKIGLFPSFLFVWKGLQKESNCTVCKH